MTERSPARGVDPAGVRRPGLAAPFVAGLALALLVVGCTSTPGEEGAGERVEFEVRAPQTPPATSPAFAPAFEALRGALEDGEEEVARRALEAILARGPEGADLDLARDFERILHGRELVSALELSLATEDAGGPGRHRLVLEARHDGLEPIRLRLPPGKLHHQRVSVDPDGFEQREAQIHIVDQFSSWSIPPREAVRLPLIEYSVPLGRAMAVKEAWDLELLSGEVSDAAGSAPAAHLEVTPCHRTLLASFLPTAPVEPEVLVEYLQREELYLPPLMERAVRIPADRRREALAGVLPILEALGEDSDARMAKITPALRWLAGTREPGVRADAWVRYLRRWLRQTGTRGNLELPADR